VIEVSVCVDERDDPQTRLCEQLQNPPRLVPRIHDDGLAGLLVRQD